MEFTAEAIATLVQGTVEGDAQVKVNMVAKIEEGKAGSMSFFSNPKYEEYIYCTQASIVMVANDFVPRHPISATLIRVENPYKAFASLLEIYAATKPRPTGRSDKASIAPTATVAPNAYVGHYAVIEDGASVGDASRIYAQVYIGARVRIGRNCIIFAGVKIYEDCVIGDNVTLHSGVVIGADGFGFAPTEDGTFAKIPQIGNVVIKDNVEVGANTCIDRATMGSTVIEKGVKLDNLIQIAHNVVIGENTVLAAQVGIAGSTKLGHNVMMGGQVGVVGHISIANGAKVGSQSGVNHSIEKEGDALLGSPAINGLTYHRAQAIFKELPSLRAKVLDNTKAIEELKKGR